MLCCYFPTTLFFIDDRKDYLKSLRLILDARLLYDFSTHPKQAVDFLQQQEYAGFVKQLASVISSADLGESQKAKETTHTYLDMNLEKVRELVYSVNRFREIGVVIVDYAMPGMSGVEVCQQLKQLPCKKIMLTGIASEEVAINAFNRGLIDHFVRKDSLCFRKELHDAIVHAQEQYFKEISRPIMQALEMDQNSALSETAFVEKFQQILEEKNILEYYLISQSGSYLMLDEKGNTYWLLVKSEQDMQQSVEIAEGNDAPSELIEPLKKRAHLLFFLTAEEEWGTPIENWSEHMYPAKKLQGDKQNYYYAFIEGKLTDAFESDRVITFVDYVKGRTNPA